MTFLLFCFKIILIFFLISSFIGPSSLTYSNGYNSADPVTYHPGKTPTKPVSTFTGEQKFTSVGQLMTAVVNFLSYTIGIFALLGIVIGGAIIMIGGADNTTLDRGKSVVVYSIIGLAIALLAYAITTLAQTFLYSFGT